MHERNVSSSSSDFDFRIIYHKVMNNTYTSISIENMIQRQRSSIVTAKGVMFWTSWRGGTVLWEAVWLIEFPLNTVVKVLIHRLSFFVRWWQRLREWRLMNARCGSTGLVLDFAVDGLFSFQLVLLIWNISNLNHICDREWKEYYVERVNSRY